MKDYKSKKYSAITDQPISDGQVKTMMEAAMCAPSAGNEQPWRFVVIRGRQTVRHFSINQKIILI